MTPERALATDVKPRLTNKDMRERIRGGVNIHHVIGETLTFDAGRLRGYSTARRKALLSPDVQVAPAREKQMSAIEEQMRTIGPLYGLRPGVYSEEFFEGFFTMTALYQQLVHVSELINWAPAGEATAVTSEEIRGRFAAVFSAQPHLRRLYPEELTDAFADDPSGVRWLKGQVKGVNEQVKGLYDEDSDPVQHTAALAVIDGAEKLYKELSTHEPDSE